MRFVKWIVIALWIPMIVFSAIGHPVNGILTFLIPFLLWKSVTWTRSGSGRITRILWGSDLADRNLPESARPVVANPWAKQ